MDAPDTIIIHVLWSKCRKCLGNNNLYVSQWYYTRERTNDEQLNKDNRHRDVNLRRKLGQIGSKWFISVDRFAKRNLEARLGPNWTVNVSLSCLPVPVTDGTSSSLLSAVKKPRDPSGQIKRPFSPPSLPYWFVMVERSLGVSHAISRYCEKEPSEPLRTKTGSRARTGRTLEPPKCRVR